MEVNVPEKLYIALNELTEDGRTFVLDHRVDYPICTEYTRTASLPSWEKSTLPNNNVTGINSEYLCYKGYRINYKELFEKLPKDD